MTVAALIVANVGLFLASGGASRIADGLEGLFGIDPAVIRGRAWELYGTTDSRGDDGAPLFPPWPEPVVGGDSPIALALMEAPDELVASRIETVHDRWAGPASEWFSHYSDALVNATRAEEERLRAIGDALTELADALEVTQWEALGLCMQVWGVLQFFGDLARRHGHAVQKVVDVCQHGIGRGLIGARSAVSVGAEPRHHGPRDKRAGQGNRRGEAVDASRERLDRGQVDGDHRSAGTARG